MIVKSESCARIQHCHRYRIALFLGYAIDRWYKNAIQRAYVVFELSHCFTRMSILSLVSFVSLIHIIRKVTRIATFKCTLKYYENLTRASRSNTGTRDELKRRWQVILKNKLAPEPFTVKDDIKLAKAVKKLSPDSEEDLKGSWSNLGLTQSGWQVKERWYILSKKIKDHEEMTISALANKILESALFRLESMESNGHSV